ncbi:MAG: PilZ domain [Gaiellales bacterium]|nr:PilZ domain [Gaiellales bacterium]
MNSGMANREQRLSVRVEFEMPVRWYGLDGAAGVTTPNDGSSIDISATGVAFATRHAPAVGATIVLHLRSEQPPLDLAEPVSVVRVTRAAGGYRCGVRFVKVNAANRATLGRFVIAVMRDRAA